MRLVKPNANDQVTLHGYKEDLLGQLQKLKRLLALEPDLPAWVMEQTDGSGKAVDLAPREAAMAIYGQLEYQGDQDRHHSVILPGIMAVSTEALAQIEAINQTKNQIKRFILSLEGQHVDIKDLPDPTQMPGDYQRMPYATFLLHKIGWARIHRKQLYRQITVLPQRPKRLGFTWAHTRRVQNRSRQDIINILDKLGEAGMADRAKILGVPDERFAMVSDAQLNARANLVFELEGEEKRQQKTLSMPMVYQQEADLPLPPCGKISSDPQPHRYRLPRLRNKIEAQPFTSEIPVFRYLAP